MPHPSLSDNDKRQLALAKWLLKRVVDKHPAEVTGHILVHLGAALHDIDLLEKDFGQ